MTTTTDRCQDATTFPLQWTHGDARVSRRSGYVWGCWASPAQAPPIQWPRLSDGEADYGSKQTFAIIFASSSCPDPRGTRHPHRAERVLMMRGGNQGEGVKGEREGEREGTAFGLKQNSTNGEVRTRPRGANSLAKTPHTPLLFERGSGS